MSAASTPNPDTLDVMLLADHATANSDWAAQLQKQARGAIVRHAPPGASATPTAATGLLLVHESAELGTALQILEDAEHLLNSGAWGCVFIGAQEQWGTLVESELSFEMGYLPDPPPVAQILLRLARQRSTAGLRRRIEMLDDQLGKARADSEALLRNMLPRSIAKRLLAGEEIIADHYKEATILFCDVVGYTGFASQAEPHVLISRLNELFQIFDRLTNRYGLEKIKTIGDAYMLAGGIPDRLYEHAESVADVANSMLKAAQMLSAKYDQAWRLRIGIHSGPAVAGVIGQSKSTFDIWGDTVNIASRMESTGVPGKIQVTEATYELLKGQFVLTPRGEVEVKGIGGLNTYFLGGRV